MHGLFRRRRLPHWDVEDETYFVTACLEGSLSSMGLTELKRYRDELANRVVPDGMSSDEWENIKQKLLFARVDQMLDGNPEVRYFEDHRLADAFRKSRYHFAEVRYHVFAWCVMPSHIHWVFRPLSNWCKALAESGQGRSPREIIVHSIQSFTALQCNRVRQATGRFWQPESYDHWIRNDDEFYRVIDYVEQNPVKAGIVKAADQWQFSSAYDRKQMGIRRGEALVLPKD